MTAVAAEDLAGQRQLDIAVIHQATGYYTASREISTLLDKLGWPGEGTRLLDPGAGDGGFLVAALARLNLAADEPEEAARRVRGYEFYDGAVKDARWLVRRHLTGRGWSHAAAVHAARLIVEERDYLLDPVPAGEHDVIAANPPYWRLARLPPGYRLDYELAVPADARADLLYAYLSRSAEVIAPGGRIGLITADRWLLNSGSAGLRGRLGDLFRVAGVERLDTRSAFYRPKDRRPGTLPRVHAVSLVLTPDGLGRPLTAEPFRLAEVPGVDGVPLGEIAEIRIAPWLGAHGVFTVGPGSGLPAEYLVPVVEPRGILPDGTLRDPVKWALVTTRQVPPPVILEHLDRNLHLMPPRGRRAAMRWLPPEPFAGKLPLDQDAVMVPRIARQLTGVRLPAGRLPVNHQLVVISGVPVAVMLRMLRDPVVQAQADALSLGVDSGYRSYTAELLRRLVIPRRHLREAHARRVLIARFRAAQARMRDNSKKPCSG